MNGDYTSESPQNVKFCDLVKQYNLHRDNIDRRIGDVLKHGIFINGPEVSEFETKLKQFLRIKYAIGVSSGTDALFLSLIALGIKEGDFVISPAFNFIAVAEVSSLLGAIPVFVDVDEDSFNLSAEKLKEFLDNPYHPYINDKVPYERIKVVVGVDLFGQCADYDEINRIAKNHNLYVIEDGAQSLGAEYKERKALTLGDINCTSFYPAKPLGCFGDGGAVFTNDDVLAEKIQLLKNHGQKGKYNHVSHGLNARLDTIQAAVLLAKFDVFVREEISLRQNVARRYIDLLTELEKEGDIILPKIEIHSRSVWAQFSIRVLKGKRDALRDYLKSFGIPAAVHYPKPLHFQPSMEFLGYKEGAFPVSEMISQEILSLPFHPYLEEEETLFICGKIFEFFS